MIKKLKQEEKVIVNRYSAWEMTGTIERAIEFLQNIKTEMNNKDYHNVNIDLDLDFSDCYYEGDSPSIKVEVRAEKQ